MSGPQILNYKSDTIIGEALVCFEGQLESTSLTGAK